MTMAHLTRMNAATLRADRRKAATHHATNAACLIAMAALIVILGDMILTTALNTPETLAQATTLKGM